MVGSRMEMFGHDRKPREWGRRAGIPASSMIVRLYALKVGLVYTIRAVPWAVMLTFALLVHILLASILTKDILL